MIPKSREWVATVMRRDGSIASVLRVSAPTRYLAQLNAAHIVGMPLVWGQALVKVSPLRARATRDGR